MRPIRSEDERALALVYLKRWLETRLCVSKISSGDDFDFGG